MMQGDWNRFAPPVRRSYGIWVDEWSDQPKNRQIEFSCHSSFQSWGSCTAGATQDRGQFDVYGDDYFANRQRQSSPFTFLLSYLTTIHSQSRFDKTSLSKCVTHVGFDEMT